MPTVSTLVAQTETRAADNRIIRCDSMIITTIRGGNFSGEKNFLSPFEVRIERFSDSNLSCVMFFACDTSANVIDLSNFKRPDKLTREKEERKNRDELER